MIAYITPLSTNGEIIAVEGTPELGQWGGFKGADGKLYGKSRWYRTMQGAERRMRELRRNRILYLEKQLDKLKKEHRQRG